MFKSSFKMIPKCPPVAVDIIIIDKDENVVLIERKFPPKGLALPGGFVDYGETTKRAAEREALEEVGLRVNNLRLVGVYSEPERDPRGHVISVAYVGEAEGNPLAGDDAKEVSVIPIGNVINMDLVMDHKQILLDAIGIYFKE